MAFRLALVTVATAVGLLVPSASGAATLPSPTVSPANVIYTYPTTGADCVSGRVCTTDRCPRGYFCASVWDPTRQARKKFHFYQCRTYALASWYSGMGATNNQTGGAVARVYDRNMRLIQSFPADNLLRGFNAHDAWYIRAC